jgi:hypothetical protein
MRAGVFGVGALSAIVFAAWAGASGMAGPPAATPAQLVRLGTIASSVAAGNGDSHPVNAQVVSSTEQLVLGLIGEQSPTNQDVFVVTLHGNFTDRNARGAAGASAPPPTGHVITLVLNQSDFSTADFFLGNGLPSTALGPAQPLVLSNRR